MRYQSSSFFAVLTLSTMSAQLVMAADLADFTNNSAPTADLDPSTIDNLILDFTMPAPILDSIIDSDGTVTDGVGVTGLTVGDDLFDVDTADLVVADDLDAPTEVWQDYDSNLRFLTAKVAESVVAGGDGDIGLSTGQSLTNAKVLALPGNNPVANVFDSLGISNEFVYISADDTVNAGDTRINAIDVRGTVDIVAETISPVLTAFDTTSLDNSTPVAHGLSVNDVVLLEGSATDQATPYIVNSVPSATTFTVVGQNGNDTGLFAIPALQGAPAGGLTDTIAAVALGLPIVSNVITSIPMLSLGNITEGDIVSISGCTGRYLITDASLLSLDFLGPDGCVLGLLPIVTRISFGSSTPQAFHAGDDSVVSYAVGSVVGGADNDLGLPLEALTNAEVTGVDGVWDSLTEHVYDDVVNAGANLVEVGDVRLSSILADPVVLGSPADGAAGLDVAVDDVWKKATNALWVPGNELVRDIDLTGLLNADELNSIQIDNAGSAVNVTDVVELSVWQDDGDGTYQGAGTDTLLGNTTFGVALALNTPIEAAERIFVTAEISANPTDLATIQAQIPIAGLEFLSETGLSLTELDGPLDLLLENLNLQTILNAIVIPPVPGGGGGGGGGSNPPSSVGGGIVNTTTGVVTETVEQVFDEIDDSINIDIIDTERKPLPDPEPFENEDALDLLDNLYSRNSFQRGLASKLVGSMFGIHEEENSLELINIMTGREYAGGRKDLAYEDYLKVSEGMKVLSLSGQFSGLLECDGVIGIPFDDSPTSAWWTPYTDCLKDYDVTDWMDNSGTSLHPERSMTEGEFVRMLREATGGDFNDWRNDVDAFEGDVCSEDGQNLVGRLGDREVLAKMRLDAAEVLMEGLAGVPTLEAYVHRKALQAAIGMWESELDALSEALNGLDIDNVTCETDEDISA